MSDNTATASPTAEGVEEDQYSLGRILLIWVMVAAPMGLILWVFVPFLSDRIDLNPGLIFMILITLGLIWQGILSYLILKREVVPFTLENVKKRIWANTPVNPRTGIRSRKMYWWTIPGIVALFLWGFFEVFSGLNDLWVETFPFFHARDYALLENLPDAAEGQWWLLGLLVPFTVFNYVLGEELLFRGVLLPKMKGVFGRWDWVANGMLFSAYHLHLIWELPSQILFRDWIYPGYNKLFKSFWMSVIVHGLFNSIFLYIIVTLMILGKL